MEQEINLFDLLAAVVRKGRQIIIFAVIVGLLFMGYNYLRANSAKGAEEESYAMAEKERKLRDLEKTVTRAEKGIDAERAYINESLYMQLNPYNIYNTCIIYSLTDLSVPLDGSLGVMENPTQYVINQIISRYQLGWAGTNLGEQFETPGYQNTEDRYLREVVSIGSTGNSSLCISANAPSEESSKNLAEAAEKVILSLKKDAAKSSYSHNLIKVSTVTKQIIDETIRDNQNAHYDALDLYVDDLSTAQKSINQMNAEHSTTGYVKKLIIGCVAGGVLAVLWFVFRSVFRRQVESAQQVVSETNLEYLGNISSGKGKGLFGNLANILSNEKVWASDEAACAYAVERICSRIPGKLLITSTDKDVTLDKVEALIQALKEKNVDVAYQPFVNKDAQALASLQNADAVLFALEKGKTKLSEVLDVKGLANVSNKPVAGFVLV